MQMIDRYIYAVTQRLPEQQREDIKKELQGLIEDMLEERAPLGQASQADAEQVLLELGHPNALAAKYRGYDRYLIGPLMMDSYLTTLRIVLFALAIAFTCIFVIDLILEPTLVLDHFIEYMVSLLNAGIQGFGWVTIVFVWVQYRQQKGNDKGDKKKEWKPSDLPAIPNRNTQIKMSEPITGIIFTILFAVLFLYSSDLVGIWRFQDGERSFISFLNTDIFQNKLWIVWVLAVLAISREIIRIIIRKRTGRVITFHIGITVVTTALICVLLADPAIWNPEFLQQLEAAGILTAGEEVYDTVVSIWSRVSDWLILVFGVLALIDICSETYKWYRAKTTA